MVVKGEVTMKLYIGARQLQTFLQVKGHYRGKIDGDFGPKSQQAAIDYNISITGPNGWGTKRATIAATQRLFVELGLYAGNVDGYWGPNSAYALEQYQNLLRDTPATPQENAQKTTVFPRYAQMEQFYGPVGQNIELYKLPYNMKLAWGDGDKITKISLHKKCAESALGVMEAAKNHYSQSGLEDLGLHLFGGSLNVRKMRGGSNWSVHSWAAAIDFDPARNAFRSPASEATLDAKIFDHWWELWEAAGWVSLGRERNYDWMHVQACRL
jgi:hypothetical protein